MQILGFQLMVQDSERMLRFYTEVLGMRLTTTHTVGNKIVYKLSFGSSDYYLELLKDEKQDLPTYSHQPQDNYWKYSLFVADIQHTFKQLLKQGCAIGEPFQLDDIGYLAHTTDPENHTIEFIQKTFKHHPPSRSTPKTNTPLLEQPALGLLTIRTVDPIKTIRFYEQIFDLKLLVRMYVKRGDGFSLYFLGHNDLIPPNPNIDAIENREWMYQQQHLFIEIQHYWGNQGNPDFSLNRTANGLQEIRFSGDLNHFRERLTRQQLQFKTSNNPYHGRAEIKLNSFDGHRIIVESV